MNKADTTIKFCLLIKAHKKNYRFKTTVFQIHNYGKVVVIRNDTQNIAFSNGKQ